MYDLITLGRNARKAARVLGASASSARDASLFSVARALREHKNEILEANRTDLELAKCAGCRAAILERLTLTGARIEAMAAELDAVTQLADPIGVVESGCVRPNGLSVLRTRVPVGVVAVVADSYPSVTVDAVALCLKSGNACVLSGGKNAYGTTRTLLRLVRQAIGEVGLPMDAVSPVEDASDETLNRLLRLNDYIDLLIPRGDTEFVQRILRDATVPALDTARGCCHIYVDRMADLSMAVRVIDNAKTSAPGRVNAVETVLVHREVAKDFLPKLQSALELHGVELRGCPETRRLLPQAASAAEADWSADYRGFVLAVRVVSDMEEAITHIDRYGVGAAEGIVTGDLAAARRFTAQVDAPVVCVNASTRFVDGAQFGLGAELGIAAQKLHVRGPVGLQALTTMKYVVTGTGHTR